MDFLEITGLSVATRIGVHDWEQRITQRLLIDIKIPANFQECHDQLSNTLDYSALCEQIIEYTESKAFQLIETVANDVALLIKDKFVIKEVSVSVCKPHAIKHAANVKVHVTR